MKQWKVIRPRKPPLYVNADYLVFDAGNLRFKRSVPHGHGHYPEDVHVIAPRAWSEVEQCSPE